MKQNRKLPLPIDPYIEEILGFWRTNATLIVKASPGSGKTTRLPWKIAEQSSKKVIVLEPRRLAAKLAAERIAFEEGLKLGSEVGHHFRFDKNHGPETKLIFYTEGTFLKVLGQGIEDVGTVILDEFHERHLETDVTLAILRGVQKKQPDLKIILMSATLDPKLKENFHEAHLIEIEARAFQVITSYLPNQPSLLNLPLETKIKKAIESLPKDSGDVLVFVPGMREMLKTREHLINSFNEVHLLHGELSKEEQDQALAEKSSRKIILATNIAESSITIPGIKVVIDSGIQREARYSPWTGLKSLEDRAITQSSAIQRAGRAGRTSDGLCIRLYSEQDFNSREAYTVPEIERADLTDTFLLTTQLKLELCWYTPPPLERWEHAQKLCHKLGAIDVDGNLTNLGKEILTYPLGTRLSRVLIEATNYSLNEKRKLLQFICHEIEKDSSGVLLKRLHFYLKTAGSDQSPWEKALLSGFIDQVSKRRPKQNDFIHYSGKTLKAHTKIQDIYFDYYLILDVSQKLVAMNIVPIEEEWLYELNPFPLTEENELQIDDRFSLRQITKIGSIPLDETILKLEWTRLSQSMKLKVLEQGESIFQKKWKEWQEDENFLRLHYWARLKNISPIGQTLSLQAYLDEWQELNWDHLATYFQNGLQNELQVNSLDIDLPRKINLGGKRDLTIHYPYAMDPYVEAPIQDFYGVTTTPSIMQGKIPLTLKLLGPQKSPIQVTKDIQGFWKKTYIEMKREWQRDYPRHHWPDTPESAPPILLKRQLT